MSAHTPTTLARAWFNKKVRVAFGGTSSFATSPSGRMGLDDAAVLPQLCPSFSFQSQLRQLCGNSVVFVAVDRRGVLTCTRSTLPMRNAVRTQGVTAVRCCVCARWQAILVPCQPCASSTTTRAVSFLEHALHVWGGVGCTCGSFCATFRRVCATHTQWGFDMLQASGIAGKVHLRFFELDDNRRIT